MKQDYWVTVCAECETASCWHGEFMCQGAQYANVKDMKASDLRRLDLESPTYYSKRNLRAVTGADPRPVVP